MDPAGNTFGRLGGGGPTVMTGSHIDTVPQGGPLDGALGVLAGLECLQAIGESGRATRLPLTVAAWSDEEGRYGSLFGSRAFIGKLDPAAIPGMAAVDGERLVDAMARAGYNALEAPKARCDPKTLSAYVELHIEQGPHLDAARIPIGLVEGIVGIRRYRLVFVGEPDHAGTTPMAWRKDAFLGAAEYALKAREHIVKKGSGRSVTNFGRIELHPGISNIVPARAELLQEMRELDPEDPRAARPGVPRPGPRHRAAARPQAEGGAAVAHRARALRAPRDGRRRPRVPGAQAQVQAHALRGRARRPEPRDGHPVRHAVHPVQGRAQPSTGRDERLEGHRARGQCAASHAPHPRG